jgi:MYXO-CTERM domain-containing protein
MRRRGELAVSLAVVAGLAMMARPAAAYVRYQTDTGAGFAWQQSCVPIVAFQGDFSEMTAAEVQAALTGAASAWNSAANPCTYFDLDVALEPAGTPVPVAAYDRINMVIFRTASWCYLNPECALDYDPAAITVTSDTAQKDTGQILDADVEVNAFGFHWADVVSHPALTDHQDLQNALTHAFGHLIGLDQPCYDPSSGVARPLDNTGQPAVDCDQASAAMQATTMFPSYLPGDTQRRTLAPDDQAGLCGIYPLTADPNSCVASAGSCVCPTADGSVPMDAGGSGSDARDGAASTGSDGHITDGPGTDAPGRAATSGCSCATGGASPPRNALPIILCVVLAALWGRRRRVRTIGR